MSINRKVATSALLAVIAFAAITGGLLLTTRAAEISSTTGTTTDSLMLGNETPAMPFWGPGGMEFARRGCRGGFGTVEVSADYIANVTSIAKNDTDVQNLLAQGYNITVIRPLFRSVVDGNGYVSTKATTAMVLLQNGTSGFASVLVDLEQGKVTQIVTITRTVIQK
jgi:hypothetical protein